MKRFLDMKESILIRFLPVVTSDSRAAEHRWTCVCLLAGALAASGPVAAEVEVSLSQTSVNLGEPFQVTFESHTTTASAPDLSPLLKDFQIASRSSRSQSSTINGRRSSRQTLVLTLIPKRAGNLSVPSIRIGEETSLPRLIRVIGAADDRGGTDQPGFESAPPSWPPYRDNVYGQPAGQPRGYGPNEPQYRGRETEYPRIPSPTRIQPRVDDTGSPQVAPAPAATPPVSEPNAGFPGWIVAALTAGWLATLAFCWARHRRAEENTPTARPSVAVAPAAPPKTPLELAMDATTKAYESGNAQAARDAWLRWAALRWPEDKPANLMGLAARLDAPARAAVLRLDEALYSPEPLAWQDAPVRVLMTGEEKRHTA